MSTSQQTDPLIGRLVDGRYRVRARIARGGMATVYVATDLRLERRVALKVMHSHLSDDSVFQSRFIQEARSAARLIHPSIINIFDACVEDDMSYIVMEYVEGVTLKAFEEQNGKMDPALAVALAAQLASALEHAHNHNIIHCDIKPR